MRTRGRKKRALVPTVVTADPESGLPLSIALVAKGPLPAMSTPTSWLLIGLVARQVGLDLPEPPISAVESCHLRAVVPVKYYEGTRAPLRREPLLSASTTRKPKKRGASHSHTMQMRSTNLRIRQPRRNPVRARNRPENAAPLAFGRVPRVIPPRTFRSPRLVVRPSVRPASMSSLRHPSAQPRLADSEIAGHLRQVRARHK